MGLRKFKTEDDMVEFYEMKAVGEGDSDASEVSSGLIDEELSINSKSKNE